MLELKNIYKKYSSVSGDVTALDDVNLQFRKNEFVSILGPSGGGKTTMLNIIGGLDQYTSGDLIIGGVSTKKYKDRDWDSYRNHSIGFIFQSYNLIMHQTVLENVELALTLSGVSKSERKERAINALKSVGLEDHIYKKPTQLSGGQTQRVAIARALINNPEILLADEPTGALDTVTSVQIMELLKEIAKDKLVIMVTHNPDLAQRYSTRIIKILDGKIIDDSNPYSAEGEEIREEKTEKTSMGFLTAMSLSFKNLLTKKGRTFLTAFAGSIGIIGIASILSLSNGIQNYVDNVQQDTLSSYPISIMEETTDMSSIISTMTGISVDEDGDGEVEDKGNRDAVYANPVMYRMMKSLLNADVNTNNLKDFKSYLDDNRTELNTYTTAIQYGYNTKLNIFAKSPSGEYAKADFYDLMSEAVGSGGVMGSMTSFMENMNSINIWEELITDSKTGEISDLITSQYDLVYGKWPVEKDELLLVLTSNNEISDITLYSLGLVDKQIMLDSTMAAMMGKENNAFDEITGQSWAYSEICEIPLKLVMPTDFYRFDESTKLWVDVSDNVAMQKSIIENGLDMHVVGIVKPNEDATSTALQGSLCYTPALTNYYIEKVNESDIVKEQRENTEYNIISGLPFVLEEEDEIFDDEKVSAFKEYVAGLNETEKMGLYKDILSNPNQEVIDSTVDTVKSMYDDMEADEIVDSIVENYAGELGYSSDLIKNMLDGYTKEELIDFIIENVISMIETQAESDADNKIKEIQSVPTSEELEPIILSIKSEIFKSLGGLSEIEKSYAILKIEQGFIAQLWYESLGIPMAQSTQILSTMSSADLETAFNTCLNEQAKVVYASYNTMNIGIGSTTKVAVAFDNFIENASDSDLMYYYDNNMPDKISEYNYADLLEYMGACDLDKPSSINIYPIDFEKKEEIARMIKEYNDSVSEEDVVSYTDFMAMLMSSVSNIINAVSVALIAFVSISLVVSSIMIGIITYISVLERTKEIGILRAIGASKRDVGRVFNAETLIIGFIAGIIGIGVTLLLTIPANVIIEGLTDISGLVKMPVVGGISLVIISVVLTLIAGLVPSRIASKKDPVESLRCE